MSLIEKKQDFFLEVYVAFFIGIIILIFLSIFFVILPAVVDGDWSKALSNFYVTMVFSLILACCHAAGVRT